MRIQVYDEEVTGEASLVGKTSETGITFAGLRIWLASPDVLHATPEDDDRSAVTFWFDPSSPAECDKYYALFCSVVDIIGACMTLPL